MDWTVREQMRLVQTAVALLRPGGCMTYSTCTVRLPENEGMVRHILDTYADMRLDTLDIKLGSFGRESCLTAEEAQCVRFFDPELIRPWTKVDFLSQNFESLIATVKYDQQSS